MNKLTRKLLVSVFTLAFALVTLGATTFAWFTLSSTAAVDQIDMQIVAGDGIEISGNGTNYRSQVPLSELTDIITSETLEEYMMMDSVTSPDGKTFKKLDGTTASGYYVEFKLYFRSPTQNARVYLTANTQIASTRKTWHSDVPFRYRAGAESPSKTEFDIFSADSLRFSIEEQNNNAGSFEDITNNLPLVFELTPFNSTANLRLDQTINMDQGLVPYWRAKTGGEDVTVGKSIVLPQVLNSETGIGSTGEAEKLNPNKTILTLSKNPTEADGYYYNYALVRLWLEGWDPDNFDAILKSRLSIKFDFGVAPAAIENYTVTFNSNEGSPVADAQVVRGGVVTEPTAPTRDGYTFAGWYTAPVYGTSYNFSTLVNGNLTLHAKWDEVVTPDRKSVV